MKRVLTITAIALLTFAFSANAQQGCGMGKGPGHGPGHGDGPGMMGMHEGRMGGGMGPGMLLMHAEELELTETQISDLEKMQVNFQTDAIDRRAELQKAKVKLRSLMRSDDASETAVNTAIDEVASLEADMKKMKYGHMQAVKEVLTEEQIDKIKELRKNRRERAEVERGMRKGGGHRGMNRP